MGSETAWNPPIMGIGAGSDTGVGTGVGTGTGIGIGVVSSVEDFWQHGLYWDLMAMFDWGFDLGA